MLNSDSLGFICMMFHDQAYLGTELSSGTYAGTALEDPSVLDPMSSR